MARNAAIGKGGPTQPKTRLEAARAEKFGPGREGLRRFARRMRRCPLYVRRVELHGRAPLGYAQEAQRHLGCHMNLFMWPDWTPPAEAEAPAATTKETKGKGGEPAVERERSPLPTPNARRLLAQEAATLAARSAENAARRPGRPVT